MLGLLAVVLAACGGSPASTQPAEGAAGPPVKLKVLLGSKTMYMGYAPFIVAKEMGYYREAGVDPELITCCGSTDVTKQIAAGQADLGNPSPEPVIIGRQPETGMKIRFFYTAYRENIYQIAVPQGSSITKLSDLKGKTIGVASLGSGGVPAGKALLRNAGLDPEKDVRFVPIGEGIQAATAIQQKRVDAASLWDAMYAEVENFNVKFTYLDKSPIARFPSNGLIARDEDIQPKGKAFGAFGRALAKGTLFTLENPAAAVRIMWKQYPETRPANKTEAEALADGKHVVESRFHVWRIDNRTTRRWGYSEEKEYAEFIDFMAQQGLVKVKVPVGELLTNKLVDDFNNFDEKKVREQARNWKP
jgi:NitT/TauT family transport system substrate-binding protein